MIKRLETLLKEGSVAINENLNNHTTFRVGGPAKALLTVKSVEELKAVIKLLVSSKEAFFVLGNGSNLLVSDKGYDGFVIKLEGEFSEITVEDCAVKAGAGAMLSKVCRCALDKSLEGLEFAYGIPGTIGGAMVMNAGAYGGEMKDVVKAVTLMDYSGNVHTLSCEDMRFGYRDSILKHESFIVLFAEFALSKGEKDEIAGRMEDVMQRRRDKQPLSDPSAGSTFKRPEGAFAGKLIQDAGLSGYRVGGASVSTKHCGFVVNDKNGCADDVYKVIKHVSATVKEASGFDLEPEVILIGQFD